MSVEVTLDAVRDGGCLIVRIREGPRYRMGDIRIDGLDHINPQFPAVRPGGVAECMPSDSFPDMVHRSNISGWLRNYSGSKDTADWVPGNPAKFSAQHQNPLIIPVRQRLAECGRPLARLTTAHDFDNDGTVDLVIHIEDEGPEAIVGRIDVMLNGWLATGNYTDFLLSVKDAHGEHGVLGMSNRDGLFYAD